MRPSGGDRTNPMIGMFQRGELKLVVTGLGVNFIVPASSDAGCYQQRKYDEPKRPSLSVVEKPGES